jgi:beta-carotene hydroxylase
MRHHAFTNDPKRDPDYHTKGPIWELPISWWGFTILSTFSPVFAFYDRGFRVLPMKMQVFFSSQANTEISKSTVIRSGKYTLRYWFLTVVMLIVAFLFGIGWEALLLWYLPARISFGWLILVFAWYPHHPAENQGRYVDTRVAVFPGSTFLIRGHDYHALHHLFPRVPHYRLPKLWREIGVKLIPKGVRTEGRALGATSSIMWK